MTCESTPRARSRSSPADRAASASRSRARSSPRRAGRDHRPQRRAPVGGAAADRERPGRAGRDAAGRRAPLRRRASARSPRPSARFGGLDILVNNAGVGIFADVADMTPDAVVRGHRHQPHRRVQRLPRGAAAPAAARRRLHHQHQQPGRQEPVRRRRRVLRVEGRAERVQRSADAGSALRQHPRQLRDARVGGHRLLERRRDEGRRLEDRARTTSPRSSSTCCGTTRAACRAASSCGPSKPPKKVTAIHVRLRQAPRHARASRDDDGHARAAGWPSRSTS